MTREVPGEVLIAPAVRINYKDIEHIFYSSNNNTFTIIKYHNDIGMWRVEKLAENGVPTVALVGINNIMEERKRDKSWEFICIL